MNAMFRRIFPHPVLTIVLTAVWVLLQNTMSWGTLAFGLYLGILIPISTSRWWPNRPRRLHPFLMFSYCMIVVWDIIVANVQVAWIILSKPNREIKSAWIMVPLELKAPEAITLLAGTITLTPGTITADMSETGRTLLIHALHTEDPDAIRDEIKQRYERRLMRIFDA